MNETSEVAYARLRLASADDNNTDNNHDKQLHATTGRSTLNSTRCPGTQRSGA